jgi:hypothetical protein
MMCRLTAVIVTLCALTGCGLFRGDELAQGMDRLVGHPVAEVTVILGPPANHSDAGGGKQTFNWERYGTYQTAGADDRLFGTLIDTAPQAHQYQCLIVVTATPARPRARPSALGDWTVANWSSTGSCR